MNPSIKKYLPLILIGVGVVVLIIVGILFVKAQKNKMIGEVEEETVAELAQEYWPAISLTPTSDPKVANSAGRFLDFKVEKISVPGASIMDYLLVYSTSDGGQQGVPGSVKLDGGDVEKKLLLGSESSGKFRFDAGVSTGTMTVTFRDSNGKSLGRLTTDFHLQSETPDLESVDGSFKYTLDKPAKGVFFITMQTFMEPTVPMAIWQDGYGVFASDGKPHTGSASN